MTDRAMLLNSIASTIQTYRAGQIAMPTAGHVDRWVSQFPQDQQLAILQEFDPLMKKCFLTRDRVAKYIGDLVRSEKVAGADPAAFWLKANFLRVQHDGNSQREMVTLLGEQLMGIYGVDINACGSADGAYVYLDDIMCTGNRVSADLESWIVNEAPPKATLHVILLITHTSGGYYLRSTKIKDAKTKSGKDIDTKYWYFLDIENTKYRRNTSEVLWPTTLPEDQAMQEYASQLRYPFEPRVPVVHQSRIFTTEPGRQVLENAFVAAGMKIRSQHEKQKSSLKPLGYGSFGIGFGSTFATYRNCPNTAPLAIWWGNGSDDGALQWYPLLPRITYSSPENVFSKLWRS
jgi:hypothetical protein